MWRPIVSSLDADVGDQGTQRHERANHGRAPGHENKSIIEYDPPWPIIPSRTERRSYSFDEPGRLDHKIIVTESEQSQPVADVRGYVLPLAMICRDLPGFSGARQRMRSN
jgi:hypothetical protein